MDESELFHTPDQVRSFLGRKNLTDKQAEALQQQVHCWIDSLIDDYFENNSNDASL